MFRLLGMYNFETEKHEKLHLGLRNIQRIDKAIGQALTSYCLNKVDKALLGFDTLNTLSSLING